MHTLLTLRSYACRDWQIGHKRNKIGQPQHMSQSVSQNFSKAKGSDNPQVLFMTNLKNQLPNFNSIWLVANINAAGGFMSTSECDFLFALCSIQVFIF